MRCDNNNNVYLEALIVKVKKKNIRKAFWEYTGCI